MRWDENGSNCRPLRYSEIAITLRLEAGSVSLLKNCLDLIEAGLIVYFH